LGATKFRFGCVPLESILRQVSPTYGKSYMRALSARYCKYIHARVMIARVRSTSTLFSARHCHCVGAARAPLALPSLFPQVPDCAAQGIAGEFDRQLDGPAPPGDLVGHKRTRSSSLVLHWSIHSASSNSHAAEVDPHNCLFGWFACFYGRASAHSRRSQVLQTLCVAILRRLSRSRENQSVDCTRQG
jgi:hypothetical protein